MYLDLMGFAGVLVTVLGPDIKWPEYATFQKLPEWVQRQLLAAQKGELLETQHLN